MIPPSLSRHGSMRRQPPVQFSSMRYCTLADNAPKVDILEKEFTIQQRTNFATIESGNQCGLDLPLCSTGDIVMYGIVTPKAKMSPQLFSTSSVSGPMCEWHPEPPSRPRTADAPMPKCQLQSPDGALQHLGHQLRRCTPITMILVIMCFS